MRTLLIGEGDFSYSVKFLEETTDFVASCLAEVNPGSPETEINIQTLRNRGVTVRTDVDARKLDNLRDELTANGLFHRVVFNFPHVGGKMHLGRNRQLLKEFFQACGNVLDKRNGRIEVALCIGQGGTPIDKLKRYDDTWKIEEMAASALFALVDVAPFEAKYSNIGYRSLNKAFNTVGALVHIFEYSGRPPSLCHHYRRCSQLFRQTSLECSLDDGRLHNGKSEEYVDLPTTSCQQNAPLSDRKENRVTDSQQCISNIPIAPLYAPGSQSTTELTFNRDDSNDLRKVTSIYKEKKCIHIERNLKFPSTHTMHFSFWVPEEDSALIEERFRENIRLHWPELAIDVEGPIDIFNKGKRVSWCFRLNISSPRYALSKELTMSKFTEMLRKNLTLWLPSAESRS